MDIMPAFQTLRLITFYLQIFLLTSHCALTPHLHEFYQQIPELQLDNFKYKFDRNENIRSVLGHHAKSALNQCVFKPSDNPFGFSTICSSPYPRNDITRLLSPSLDARDYVEIDCHESKSELSALDIKLGYNRTKENYQNCVCFDLEKYPNTKDDDFASQDTVISSYEPGCLNGSIRLTPDYFMRQGNVKVLAMSHAPFDAVLPDTFHDLTSLEFVSFINNSFGDLDLPKGAFCNNVNLKTVHFEGSLFTGFPTQVFQCPRSIKIPDFWSCFDQLTTIVVSNTDIQSLPERLLGCAANVTHFTLTFSSLSDVSNLSKMKYISLKLLDLSHNQIYALEPYTFGNFPNLEYLDLSHNIFSYIDSTWFHKSESLKTLLLDSNIINAISESLHSLPVAQLSLGFNHLEIFPANFINGSNTLVWLDLQGNDLHVLEPGSLCDIANLDSLNISANKFSSLFEVGLAFCENSNILKMLFMHENNISSIGETDLSAYSGLDVIVMNNNVINDIHLKAFTAMSSLRVLFLENNFITDIKVGQLSFLKALRFLHLGNNNISKMHPGVFAGLYYIGTLGLAHNRIEKIEQFTLNTMYYLTNLRLEHNYIRTIDTNSFPNRMTSLNLTDNFLKSPPCLKYANSLQVLILNMNNISSIHKSSFCDIKALIMLQMANNVIESLEPGSFLSAPSLQYIDFTNNRLNLNFSVNYFEGIKLPANFYFYLNRIRSIENLYLHVALRMAAGIYIGFNPIVNIPQQPENAFYHLPIHIATNELDLSGCNISTIDQDAFVHLVTIKKIILNGNKISYLPDLRFNSIVVYASVAVELYENNIECSCAMKWMQERELVRNIYHFRFCQNPINQSTAVYATFPKNDFVCRTDYLCDKTLCTCFADDIADPPKIANCSMRYSKSLPRILPVTAEVIYLHGNSFNKPFLKSVYPSLSFQARKLTLNNCSITVLQRDSFDHFRYLKELYLHDNSISTLPKGIFSYLKMLMVLTLNNNLLMALPQDFLSLNNILQDLKMQGNLLTILSNETRQSISNMYYLKTLCLYENPWICECDNLSWKTWLLGIREKLSSSSLIKCENGSSVLATPDDDFLCRNETIKHIRDIEAFALTTSLAVVLPLFTIVTMITVFYHRHLLAVFAFTYLGVRFASMKNTEDLEYEAILLYNEEEYGSSSIFSSIVIPTYDWMIGFDPPFKVMVPDLHILAGTIWAEEMCKGIHSSQKFLIFLSIDFLKTEKTMFLFHTAYHVMVERRSNDLILILDSKDTFKYIRSAEDVDQRLKAFLQTNSYLIMGRRHFHKRLLYLLPGQSRRKQNFTENGSEMHDMQLPESMYI